MFLNNLPPTKDSAYHRATHPKSWWWTPEMDFYSAILHALRGANWQRAGGQGAHPEPVERPPEREPEPEVTSLDELRERQKAVRDELERRRHEPRREVKHGQRG